MKTEEKESREEGAELNGVEWLGVFDIGDGELVIIWKKRPRLKVSEAEAMRA